MPRLVLVVPCYNEAARLPVAQFEQYVRSTATEIIFVDDGSRDDTPAVLRGIQSACPDRVTIIRSDLNLGKGDAVRCGITEALLRRPDYVGFWDADLSTPLDAVDSLLGVLAAHPDCRMVFGSRVRLLGRDIVRPAHRHYLGRVFATVASLILRLPVYDTQCGAKLFRVTAETASLFAEPFHSRWIFDVEIVVRFVQAVGSVEIAAARIIEFPLRAWKDVAGSKIRPRHFLVTFLDLCRIYFTYGRGPAGPKSPSR